MKDSVAFYDRNALRVQDELETLARNEAPGLGADTVQPLGPPDGRQPALRRLEMPVRPAHRAPPKTG